MSKMSSSFLAERRLSIGLRSIYLYTNTDRTDESCQEELLTADNTDKRGCEEEMNN